MCSFSTSECQWKRSNDGVLSNVVAGLPTVAELIATVPEEKRERALNAAEVSYLNTARKLGYGEADVQRCAAAVMLQSRAEVGEVT